MSPFKWFVDLFRKSKRQRYLEKQGAKFRQDKEFGPVLRITPEAEPSQNWHQYKLELDRLEQRLETKLGEKLMRSNLEQINSIKETLRNELLKELKKPRKRTGRK